MTAPALPHIVVTAAIVERDGTFLVTRRPPGVHLAGFWEFPGGKCQPGESHERCLRREIGEELDADVTVLTEVFSTRHAYPDRVVDLHFFNCALVGEPRPMIGQEMRWVTGDALVTLEFPPADTELIALLRSGS